MKALERARQAVRAARPLVRKGRLREVTPFLLRCTGAGAALHEQVEIESSGRYGAVRAEVVALRGTRPCSCRSATRGLPPPAPWSGGPAGGSNPRGPGAPGPGPRRPGQPHRRPPPPSRAHPVGSGPRRARTARTAAARAPVRHRSQGRGRVRDPRRGAAMGLFAGPGAGKSRPRAARARGAGAEVCVLGLVGERGREVSEMVEDALGPEGLRRSVVVAATSDAPAVVRMRSAQVATAVAEWFARVEGRSVLLLVDSLTRFARAVREVGLRRRRGPGAPGIPGPRLLRASPARGAGGHGAGGRHHGGLHGASREGTRRRIRCRWRSRGCSTATWSWTGASPRAGAIRPWTCVASLSRAMPASHRGRAAGRCGEGAARPSPDGRRPATWWRRGPGCAARTPALDAAADAMPAIEAFLRQDGAGPRPSRRPRRALAELAAGIDA